MYGAETDSGPTKTLFKKRRFRMFEVGTGATICLYTDRYACTVIKRTEKTLTLRRDKAVLDPAFKPDFIPGGFLGTVVNQNEQEYTYEEDPEGEIFRAYWSEKNKGFYVYKCLRVTEGRHEFYDYNF